MTAPTTCIVTIHGIGFQEPPREGIAGYADDLHANLKAALPELSDDPTRQPWEQGDSLPIYVQSRYPSGAGTRESGLARLGAWKDHLKTAIDVSAAPLLVGEARVSHVALVYAELEDLGAQPAAALEALVLAAAEHGHYGSILSTLHTVLSDARTALFPPHQASARGGGSSLRPRTDAGTVHRHLPHLWHHGEDASEPPGIAGTIRQLEDDVCGYVARNDLRHRIQSFVREALLRLAARDDVGAIVLNTHSNGTVMGFDALRDLPAAASARVRTLVTAGSPVRKYAELFSWGHEVGSLRHIGEWVNYYDPRDPVADPLGSGYTPFVSEPPDAKAPVPFPITDVKVDNVANSSGGGLQAHNYWDNQVEFIPALAALAK